MRLATIVLCSLLLSCSAPPSIEDLLAPYLAPNAPGGAVLVVRNDTVACKQAFGLADVEAGIPNTTSTNFRLASVTKQFTAMSILILAHRQQLTFDQALAHFFPDFAPVGRKITVHHLLTHTSGLLDYEDLMPDTTTVPILDEGVLELLAPIDSTYFEPGSQYRYSNSGYALLALIVERVSGTTFASFLWDNIFLPLEMTSTVAYEKGISGVQRRAFGYSPADSTARSFLQTDQSMTSSVLGDGGIYSSVEDLLRWDRALTTERLVPESLLEQAFTPHAVSEDGLVRYGYGWMVEEWRGERMLYHAGSTVGFRTFILRVPEKSTSVIVLMNRADGNAEEVARGLLELSDGF